MTLSDFERKLASNKHLPGSEAFKLLGLPRKEPSSEDLENARKAAVSIIVSEIDETPKILFIKRANYKGVHSSQMAFPGGKLEPEDASMLDCAVRETLEEIGLDLSLLSPSKTLSPIYIPPSRFLVQPYVFIAPNFDYTMLPLQQDEVQSLHFLEANTLLKKQPFDQKKLQKELGTIVTKGIVLDGEFIWGASAAMLAELHHILSS